MISQEKQQYTQRAESPFNLSKIQKITITSYKKSAIALEKRNWTITFTWLKAHAGTCGNELVHKLVKEAAGKDDISFYRIPENEIVQVRDQSIAK